MKTYRPRHPLITSSASALLTFLILSAAGALASSSTTLKTVDLPAAERARLSAAVGENDPSYHAVPGPGGYRMQTRNHALSSDFGAAGVRFVRQTHRWGMTFRGAGYGETLRIGDAVAPYAIRNRIEYRRDGLTEWYVNSPLGVEQGFTIARPPGVSKGRPLTVALALSGGMKASLENSGSGLLLTKDGVAAIRYSGLTAWDADGRELRSWLEVDGSNLLLRVNDSGATYPVTVDPYVQAAQLTSQKLCSTGTCDDADAYPNQWFHFGTSVAMTSDGSTVVVGASGAAYVFLRPAAAVGGWNSTTPLYYAAKLTPSDSGANTIYFGYSVAITPDGSTIVVGDPEFYTPGKVYVYMKPASGWSSSATLMQTAKLTSWWRPDSNQLGWSVAVSPDGRIIAAGAPTMTSTRTYQGGVYVYLKPTNGWINSTENTNLNLSLDARNYEYLGSSVSISADGNTIAAGAPYTGGTSGVGAAWIFSTYSGFWGTSWRDAKLVPSDNNEENFGRAVQISADGKTVVVGASACGAIECGYVTPGVVTGAYVYVRPGESWASTTPRTENAKLISSTPSPNEHVAAGVAINSDGSLIAATSPTDYFAGIPPTVRVYTKPASGWTNAAETMKFTTAESVNAIAMSSDFSTMALGAPMVKVGTRERHGVGFVFTGSPTSPQASVSPSSLSFGSQPVGSAGSSKTVTLTNTGTAPLEVTSVAVTGSFTATQNCRISSPIAPGSSCSEQVSLNAASVGVKMGVLTFTNNSGGVSGATQPVALDGTVVKANTTTTITGLTSGNPALVGRPVNVAYTVAPQAGVSLTPSGTVTVKASTGESCTGNAPSGSCTIVFTTAVDRVLTATYNGDANFNGSASSGTIVHVVNFTLSVSPSSQTVAGRKATYAVTVSPANGFTGTVALSCNGGPAGTTCTMSPGSVTVSGSPLTSNATFTVPAQAPKGTYTVTVSGQFGGVTRSATATMIVK